MLILWAAAGAAYAAVIITAGHVIRAQGQLGVLPLVHKCYCYHAAGLVLLVLTKPAHAAVAQLQWV